MLAKEIDVSMSDWIFVLSHFKRWRMVICNLQASPVPVQVPVQVPYPQNLRKNGKGNYWTEVSHNNHRGPPPHPTTFNYEGVL